MFFDQPGTTGKLPHYFKYAQKLFEVSEKPETESLAIVTWGLGGVGTVSHRSLVARLSDSIKIKAKPATTLQEVANRWTDLFWNEWSNTLAVQLARVKQLIAKSRTPDEEQELPLLMGLGVGFCVGGCCQADNRNVGAFEILFDPRLAKPSPKPLPIGLPAFLGVPNIMKRLLLGADERLVPDLMKSGKWTGTEADLNTILQNYYLKQSLMPIRDGIDFVHAGIYSTIKGLKFSNLSQLCGGPIEIAVITSDRPFRWVRHKRFDEKPVGNGAISSATIAHGSICRNVRAFQAARMVPPTRPTASFGRPA